MNSPRRHRVRFDWKTTARDYESDLMYFLIQRRVLGCWITLARGMSRCTAAELCQILNTYDRHPRN